MAIFRYNKDGWWCGGDVGGGSGGVRDGGLLSAMLVMMVMVIGRGDGESGLGSKNFIQHCASLLFFSLLLAPESPTNHNK